MDECIFGGQKPDEKTEPKFKFGDWVVDKNGTLQQILSYKNGIYKHTNGYSSKMFEDEWRLWDITKDAKDGDVLAYVTDEEDLWIMIYWSLYEPYEGHVHYHALLVNDNFSDKGTCCICINDLKPATKEQRDIFFQKMKEAGYKWNADTKELKKIEENSFESDRVVKAMRKAGYEWSEETPQLKKIVQKPAWCPSKKQMESLKDMLKYNIGVFDYQKFMEVNSLYDDLKKILDYETDRQR